jgi:3-oxoacyl-(acyl-carrier-protein) synthase
MTSPDSGGAGAARAMTKSLSDARAAGLGGGPGSVGYVNAHATGTLLGECLLILLQPFARMKERKEND